MKVWKDSKIKIITDKGILLDGKVMGINSKRVTVDLFDGKLDWFYFDITTGKRMRFINREMQCSDDYVIDPKCLPLVCAHKERVEVRCGVNLISERCVMCHILKEWREE